jgi:hypothetical protein
LTLKTNTKIYKMKKAIIYFSIFSISLLSITSCSSKKGITQKEITKDSIVETLHDTVFSVEKDSSYYKALLECQNGKVIIKGVTGTTSGRKLKPPKVVIQDNVLQVDCEAEAEKLFAFWKSIFIKKYKGVTEPVITNELTWFQKTQIYIGRTCVALVALYLLLLLFKLKKL